MTQMPIKRKYGGKSLQGGEAGFTLIEMIIVMVLTSILGTFTFQIITNSLQTQRNLRDRKERGDDAVMALEKISREVREATEVTVPLNSSSSNTSILTFEKNITSNEDTNLFVEYWLNTSTLRRHSVASGSLPGDVTSTLGKVVAENVSSFSATKESGGGSNDRIVLSINFTSGSEWETKIYPMNYGL